jgi:hypothetical protein
MGQKATTVSLAESATLFTMASVDFLTNALFCSVRLSQRFLHTWSALPLSVDVCAAVYFRPAPSQQQNEAMCAYNRAEKSMATRFGAVISDHRMLQ